MALPRVYPYMTIICVFFSMIKGLNLACIFYLTVTVRFSARTHIFNIFFQQDGVVARAVCDIFAKLRRGHSSSMWFLG